MEYGQGRLSFDRGGAIMLRSVFLLLALMWVQPAGAQEIHPFVSGSIKEITTARQGKPFILSLWSLTCAHCRHELAALSGLQKKYPGLDVVLISTDSIEESAELAATLQQFSLNTAQAWVFADPFAERLRFEIDPKWHGELPRAYLYDAAHQVRAFSGKLDPQQLERWVKTHFFAK